MADFTSFAVSLSLLQIREPALDRLQVIWKLIEKINRGADFDSLSPDDLGRLVARCSSLINSEKGRLKENEMQSCREFLKDWKDRLLSDPKALGQWLRNRNMSSEPLAVTRNGCVAKTPFEIGECVANFWKQFWEMARDGSPGPETRDEVLRRHAVTAQVTWRDPTLGEVLYTARLQSGSGGPDGWTGDQVRHLPTRCLELFRSLALTWGPRNQIPRQFLESRCVQIPKGSKVMEGCISARDLRPITIQSCFWRLWASVLLRSAPMKQWIAQAMPAEVISGCGPKAEAQIAAASVLHGVSVDGYGCTLDFTKCYDSLDPRGTVSLLQAAGLPDSWVNTLSMVWTQQSRWILWGGCVMPDKLQATEATPQGDPWGPLALQLWMAAGNGFVHENLTPDLRNGITRIFMDDRSFSAKTPEGLLEKRRLWGDWSHQVGLLEHPDKTQFVGSSQRHSNDLRDAGVDAALVPDQWEILGVTAALTRRRESAKEQSRLDAAVRTIHLLSTLRLGYLRFHDTARAYGISQCVYG